MTYTNILSIINRYQILLCFFIAVLIARICPYPGIYMSEYGFLNFFIIIIFACIGLTFDKNKIQNVFSIQTIMALVWTLIASVLLAPAIGYFVSREIGLSPGSIIGIVLICASTPTLVAGPIMARQMGGNFEVSTAFSTIVKVTGLFLIPPVLALFIGSVAQIDQGALIQEMLFLMIIPGFAGQGLRLIGLHLVEKFHEQLNWLVIASNFFLAYIAFSCMYDQLCKLTLSSLLLLAGPCIIIHLVHIMLTARFGKHALRLPKDINISVVITACQKNMAVPLSIWAMLFTKTYPEAILAVVIYYLVQFFFDSCLLSFADQGKKNTA